MTGEHVQGDLMAPEDVVSLLIDDAQLEQKLKEIPLQAKERQKKKGGGTKGIRVDADGGVFLEDFADTTNGFESTADPDKGKSSKKRKSSTDKQAPSKSRPQKVPKNVEYSSPNSMDDPPNDTETRPQRPKRPTKSVNENLEPAFTATQIAGQDGNQKPPLPDPSSGGRRTAVEAG